MTRKEAGWSIYPNLEGWIGENYSSMTAFAKAIGISATTMSGLLSGKFGTTKYVIDLILKITGMTYEECFLGK